MRKSVIESYPQLWHYTTALGLQGILSSQQLWATHIQYLNDAEEFTGFFDRKLISLLREGVQDGLTVARQTAEGRDYIHRAGGEAKITKDAPSALLTSLRETTLKLQVYVASFCSAPSHNSDDGLLSQWRGYGPDGGYAIVFDTQGLHALFDDEIRRYFYSYGHLGDVDYFHGESALGAAHVETLEWEADIRKTIASIICENNQRPAEALFKPILSLATRHKHRGFREESEVRFSVATSMSDKQIEDAHSAGDTRPKKPVQFAHRGGILVPYVALFERPNGEKAKLPIKKVIVGPHPEKIKRQKAVEKLLGQLGIDAEVVASDIPYLGR